MKNDKKFLEVKDIKTYFFLDRGVVKAVNDVSFSIEKGKTLGIVGESGCGKSVTAQSILQIVPSPGEIVDGQILLHEKGKVTDIVKLDPAQEEIKKIRGGKISMVFQEPMTSFSPVYTIGSQIIEAILIHTDLNKKQAREKAINILKQVGIPYSERRIDEYPHQLSGGMRQRAMIAMALSSNPSLLIADEPTTALDVTIQAQILDLMNELKEDFGMSIMFITHDLGVIAEMADDVVVMYLGRVVEYSDVDNIYHDSKHPYTNALLKSIPRVTTPKGEKHLDSIEGVVPEPTANIKGCPFSPRCNKKIPDICDKGAPPILKKIEGNNNHKAACFLYENGVNKNEQKCNITG